MRLSTVFTNGVLSTIAWAATPESADALLSSLQEQALANFKNISSTLNGTCTLSTARVRKDWAALSTAEKKSYISSVQCLLESPAKSDPDFAPGAKRRYDDFAAVHINQTMTIHVTGNFLTWHRYFVHSYEEALRTECGYKGPLPFWNWFSNGGDIKKSPVFDGSDTSLGGDGAYEWHNGSSPITGLYIPSGTGGGCIASGPFANMTANLGPIDPAMAGMATVNASTPLAYNPRCAKRDLSTWLSTTYFTYENLYNITQGAASGSVGLFQGELQGRFGDLFLGTHASGHVAVGGDASDLYSSVVDPSFYLQHGMIDYMYWLWQMLHPDIANELMGTITMLNDPPSRDTLPTDPIYLSEILAPTVTIADLFSTMGGPLCYYYEY